MTAVSKSASEAEAYRCPLLFYSSAREGFQDFLTSALPPGDGVLLPEFIGWSPREGSGVFDPVRASGAPYGFYELNTDLTVDFEKLEHQLSTGKWGVLVVIHYWGRTEPQLASIAELAAKHGVILVEDLAHAFYSAFLGGAAGSHGAVNLFSLHKMFPMSLGGMVQYRDRKLLSGQRETQPELGRKILDYDWSSVAAVRRRNFRMLSELLRQLPELDTEFKMVWSELNDLEVPQSLPLVILNGKRDAIYSEMNSSGYGVTSLYHTLIDQLAATFPSMHQVSQQITNLPVHQDVRVDQIPGMVSAFRECLKARSGHTGINQRVA